MLLSEQTASASRLALVGLAKNTGKTVTLATLLSELRDAGTVVGVTSVGRDGEERDVIDPRIEKPRVELVGGSLVATTDALLRDSGLPHEVLEQTDVRTPLGRVLVARLRGGGVLEIAGPSAAAAVGEVVEAMLAHGAERTLIDGAIDRRAASSPTVADGLVIATGAILSADIEEVAARTRDAVELVRLPAVAAGSELERRLADLDGRTALLDGAFAAVELEPRFALTAADDDVARLLDAQPDARWVVVGGALPESFLAALAASARRRGRELTVVVGDPTKVFLNERGPGWYARQGVELRVLAPISLLALTVNPVAPQSHSFDSAELRELIGEAIDGVSVIDVLHPAYRSASAGGG